MNLHSSFGGACFFVPNLIKYIMRTNRPHTFDGVHVAPIQKTRSDCIPDDAEKYCEADNWEERAAMSQVTKRALEQSLKNLLLKKPLTKITINDIADDCGINRMTFYYHFKDIYDLVEWACLEDAKRALEEKKTYETWQQGLLQIFEAVQENKPFILNVYRCVHGEQVEKYLQPLVDQLLLDVINEEVGEMKVRDEDKQFIAQIYSYIFIGLMLDWIKDDMREDPQQIVDRLAKLIKGSMSEGLSRFKL